MPARMNILRGLALLLLLLFSLTGCRVRTRGAAPAALSGDQAARTEQADAGDAQEAGEDRERTIENPDAARKEFDEAADAEIIGGTDRALQGPGEGEGAFAWAGEGTAESKLNADAEPAARQRMAAPESERMGTAEDAEMADSAFRYYSVLLKERSESLYVCKKLNLYWETAEDHVTVYKNSPEHALILEAGAFDVSARLLPENLRVDDGWVCRKNPEIIVKAADKGVLGPGVTAAGEGLALLTSLTARPGWSDTDAVKHRRVILLAGEMLEAPHLRLAAALVIAKTANPEAYEDVDVNRALSMLVQEATGEAVEGVFYLTMNDI